MNRFFLSTILLSVMIGAGCVVRRINDETAMRRHLQESGFHKYGLNIHHRLSLAGTNVTDIEPLKGLDIEELVLFCTSVTDISPLKDMPLQVLDLSCSPIDNLEPLREMGLHTLILLGTPVEDISPLNGMSLSTLVLPQGVTNISSLVGMPLRHLVLWGHVSDLSAIEGMSLESLSFLPEFVTNGMSVVRSMTSLRLINNKLPETFWTGIGDVSAHSTFAGD